MKMLLHETFDPLRNLLEEEQLAGFMAMAVYLNSRGDEVYTYKHIITRNYINVDLDGNIYHYTPGAGTDSSDYRRVALDDVIAEFAAAGFPLHLRDRLSGKLP